MPKPPGIRLEFDATPDIERLMALLGVENWPGYEGAFSRRQFPGAIPNSARVVKVWTEPGDMREAGAKGTVLGSVMPLPHFPVCYFIEWDDSPKCAVFIQGDKIAEDK